MEWISVKDKKPRSGIAFQGWFKDEDGNGFWEPRAIFDRDKGYGLYGRIDYDEDGWDFGLTHLTLTHWMYQPEPPK
jgi:hypothetical protein